MSDSEHEVESTAHKILAAIEPLIYAKRKLTMAILTAITAFLFFQMVQIKPDAGFDKSVPLEHPYMQVLKQYMTDFGGANTVLVALMQKDGKGEIYTEEFLKSLKQATDEVSRQRTHAVGVIAIIGQRRTFSVEKAEMDVNAIADTLRIQNGREAWLHTKPADDVISKYPQDNGIVSRCYPG